MIEYDQRSLALPQLLELIQKADAAIGDVKVSNAPKAEPNCWFLNGLAFLSTSNVCSTFGFCSPHLQTNCLCCWHCAFPKLSRVYLQGCNSELVTIQGCMFFWVILSLMLYRC